MSNAALFPFFEPGSGAGGLEFDGPPRYDDYGRDWVAGYRPIFPTRRYP